MAFPQYQSYVNDHRRSQQAAPTHSSSEWGVDRLADRVPDPALVSDYSEHRSSYHHNDARTRQWSTPSRESNKSEYFSYNPTPSSSKYQHNAQHSFSTDYQGHSISNRVYEPRPSPKELIENDSKILEVQLKEVGPLPLLLNPLKEAHQNQSAELSAQASLEDAIMMQLQNTTISSSNEKRHSTLETDIINPIKRATSPPIPTPRTSEWYTSSPATSSPSSSIFPQDDSFIETNNEDAPSPSRSPSGPSSNNMSPAAATNAALPPASNPDGWRQSNQSHFIMIPIGRTGHGKSSLLNSIIGYDEFKASNSVQGVTDAVTERTAVWKVDKKRNLVTIADTPGFADPNRQDPKWKEMISSYIKSIGKRFGIDAFMLTFRLGVSADVFFKIVEEFVAMMNELQPNTWWDNVIFVFTRFDHSVATLQQTVAEKMLIAGPFMTKLQATYNLSKTPPVVFLGTQQPVCGYARGLQCDCVEATRHLVDGQRRLLRAVTARAVAGRWCYQEPESDEEDEEDDELSQAGASPSDGNPRRRPPGSMAKRLERRQTKKQHTNTVIRNLRQNGP